MYRIGEFSKMSKTTIKSLRYYDEVGLLKPETTDKFTNYRFYTTQQLILLHEIQSFRQIGFSIDEIKLILSGIRAERLLKKRRIELTVELKHIKDQLSRIEFILSGKEEECFMQYHATIKELPACIVYTKEMVAPNYNAYFELLPAVGQKVRKANPEMKCTVPEYCFIIYLDGEYKENDIHIKYCEAVDRIGKETDGIKFENLEVVTGVSVMHKGAYTGLPQAYAYAFKWMQESGYITSDSPRESYIDGIWNKSDEQDWLTELQFPITKK